MPTKKPVKTTVARSRGAQVKKPAPQAGTVRVAAIQMASGPNVSANLAEAERLIELAVGGGAGGRGARPGPGRPRAGGGGAPGRAGRRRGAAGGRRGRRGARRRPGRR